MTAPAHSMPPPQSATARADTISPRWRFLDSLRGFSLAGILLVNAPDITRLGYGNESVAPDAIRDILFLTVQTRFVPIFVFLFGMSLFFVAESARRRSARPWLVVGRRLLALALIGGLLFLAYPGNILIEYGIVGLLALPIVLFAPRGIVLGAGVVGTVGAYVAFGGGLAATPGLMFLGAAAAAYGLPKALENATPAIGIALAVAIATAVPALIWQLTEPGDPRFTTAGGVAGLLLAAAYTAAFSFLWRTPCRRVIAALFDPLGRMALTNYIAAAVVFALAALVVDFGHMTGVLPAVLMSVGVLAAQSVASRLWLRSFAYGPAEWLVRSATWMAPARMRRRRDEIPARHGI